MTQQQANAEMKYRLSKYVLQILINEEIITEAEALSAKRLLLEKYNPFTRCLEEVDVWQTEL